MSPSPDLRKGGTERMGPAVKGRLRSLAYHHRQILMGKGEGERMGPDVCANDQEQKIYNKLDLETTPDLNG